MGHRVVFGLGIPSFIGIGAGLFILGGVLGGWGGYRVGHAGVADLKEKQAIAATKAIRSVAVNDAKASTKLQKDKAKIATSSATANDMLDRYIAANPVAAARMCFDDDLLRIVNDGRAGGVRADPAGPGGNVPAVAGARVKDGGGNSAPNAK